MDTDKVTFVVVLPEMTWPAQSVSHGSDRVRMRGFFPAFSFFLSRVVQNVGARDQRSRDPEMVPLVVRMCNRDSPVFSGFFGYVV
jgi:hypothetical protein